MKVTTLGAWLDKWHDDRVASAPRNILDLDMSHARAKGVMSDLLDATLLQPDECPDCVGVDAHEGECQRCHGSGEISRSVGAADFMDECPNCDGTGRGAWTPCGKRKAVIVPKEQWEAFVCSRRWPDPLGPRSKAAGVEWYGTHAFSREKIRIAPATSATMFEDEWREMEKLAVPLATALLGGKVYRATEVGTLRIDTEGRAYVWNDVDGDQPIADHSTIAILEEAHGKEEE